MVAASVVLAAWTCVVAGAVPQITQPVTDLADVLSPDDEETIARTLVSHHEATGVQLAVLLVDSTHEQDIADFAQATFVAWGGGSAERDDGALFVLAIADRRSRLHLGYGLEPLIPDASAKRMLDALRPQLQAEDYGGATAALVDGVLARTAHLEPGGPVAAPLGTRGWLWVGMLVLGLLAGIAWGFVLERGLIAHAAARVEANTQYRSKPWSERARLTRAFLVRHRPFQILLGALATAQLLLVVLFRGGEGFALAYTAIFWLFVPIGWLLESGPKSVSITVGVVMGLVFSVGLASTGIAGFLPDAAAIWDDAGPLILCSFAFAGMGLLAVLSSDASGSSDSSGSSSYSSSSYSSGSSSYSSSSYSSSSYSGGGGSSGGGGASSSW